MGLFSDAGNAVKDWAVGGWNDPDLKSTQDKYGLSRAERARAGWLTSTKRALAHANPLNHGVLGSSGRMGENLLNTVGGLTKHQKVNSPFMSRLTVQGLPGAFALYGIANGEDLQDTLAYVVAPGLGMATYGVATELGFAASRFASPLTLGITGWTSPVLARAVGGIAAAGVDAAGMALAYSTDNDNFIKRTAQTINRASFMGSQTETRGTLTHRQKMLNKLAKSGLNDRGALLRE